MAAAGAAVNGGKILQSRDRAGAVRRQKVRGAWTFNGTRRERAEPQRGDVRLIQRTRRQSDIGLVTLQRPEPGNTPMLLRHDLRDRERAEDWLLDTYVEGWAEADADLILRATAPNYCFDDPLVGRFARASLQRYFTLLHERFARTGAMKRRDVAFILRGPVIGTRGLQFWREAPGIGLTGMSEIVVGPHGIVAERTAYDLNMACGQLCGT